MESVAAAAAAAAEEEEEERGPKGRQAHVFVRLVEGARECTKMSGIKFWCERKRGLDTPSQNYALIPLLPLLYYISIRDPCLMRCWVPSFPSSHATKSQGDRGLSVPVRLSGSRSRVHGAKKKER